MAVPAALRRLKPVAAEPTPPETRIQPRHESGKLWLCAYLPELALEVLNIGNGDTAAITDKAHGRLVVYAVSQAARQAGVDSGQSPQTAQALCPALTIQPRDPNAERRAVVRLANALLSFTPWVSLDRPDCLLLEVSTCLTLFGGLERLRDRVADIVQQAGHQTRLAAAPTADAAECLARHGLTRLVTQREALRSVLGPLPVSALVIDAPSLKRLFNIGVRTLTDIWRLPRDGLNRRFGATFLKRLDALAGQNDSLLRAYHRPPRFDARCELPAELQRLDHISPAIEHLAREWRDFLQARDAATDSIELRLYHHRRPYTSVILHFRQAHRDPDICCRLLRDKLERTVLPAPALAVSLHSRQTLPFTPDIIDLFDDARREENHWQTLLTQLQTRLGDNALRWLHCHDDHRPEQAHSLSPRAMPNSGCTLTALRPLWLLQTPQAIEPPSSALSDCLPERIESGWWDGHGIRRDYYRLLDAQGRRLWLFKALDADRGWHLHGLFG